LATVRSHAKLAYNGVAAWLEGNGPQPAALAAAPGLDRNLRLQSSVAQRMKNLRHVHGALSLETTEAEPVFDGERLSDLEVRRKNLATDIVEDFMIAANGATARYLTDKGAPSIRRVVRTPQRWDRIVELAAEHGASLPDIPDARALEDFLNQQKAAAPLTFPDLSLAIIKLLGPGEYVAEPPGGTAGGHFGLAVKDYTHSTAPNRRFTDLITQRLLKAALSATPAPYSMDELTVLAAHCTEQEDAINKVERQVSKSAAALLLEARIGEQFDAIVTGAAAKGTWARLLTLPVEGKVVQGFRGLNVGQRVRVELTSVDVERGFIDLRAVRQSRSG
jgi:exoribonuclease R